MVLDLLDGVEVYGVVVCAKFLTLEEIDRSLVQLQDDYFVEEV